MVSRRMTTRGLGMPRRLIVTDMVLSSWVPGRRAVTRRAVAGLPFSTGRASVGEEFFSVGRLASFCRMMGVGGAMRADGAGPSSPSCGVCRPLTLPLVGSVGRRAAGSHRGRMA
jgi:hypothetical protein